jgi:hypothetical protein
MSMEERQIGITIGHIHFRVDSKMNALVEMANLRNQILSQNLKDAGNFFRTYINRKTALQQSVAAEKRRKNR